MEYLKITKYNLEAKRLRPIDFLGSESGVVFSIFSRIKNYRVYGQMQKDEEVDKDNILKLFSLILPVAIKDYKKEMLKDFTFEELGEITNTIIFNSVSVFGCMQEISRKFALFIDRTATRYGKTPIEIMIPNGGYNDLDAYLFNSFIENIAVNYENANTKRK